MEGKDKYLQSLNEEEADLEARSRQLKKRREFYNNCQAFVGEDMENILRYIIPMISKVEGEEYVDHTFSKKENDHYETEWVSPIENLPGVSGAEIAATAEPRSKLVKGKSFQTRIIVDKRTCDTFTMLNFSNCSDYKTNLSRMLSTKKYFEIKRISIKTTKHFDITKTGFKKDMFSEMFPYISKFLERLTDWRLENETEQIPEEVLASIANSVTTETLSKSTEGPVKVVKKDN